MLDIKSKRLSHEETMLLITAAQQGSEEAKEELIYGYKDLVYKIVNRTNKRKSEFEDTVQIGMMALLDAIKRFDTSTGYSFTTYAYPYVSGIVLRNVREYNQVKIPRTILNIRSKILKNKLSSFSIEEISEKLKEPDLKLIKDSLELISNGRVSSLSETIYSSGDGDAITLQDVLNKDLNGEDWGVDLEIRDCFSFLTDKEQQVIQLYYFQDKTHPQISKILGIAQSHVSRLKLRAITKLQLHLGVGAENGTSIEEHVRVNESTRGKTGDREKAIELFRETTMTIRKIAELTGVPYGTAKDFSKRYRSKEVTEANKKRGQQAGCEKAKQIKDLKRKQAVAN